VTGPGDAPRDAACVEVVEMVTDYLDGALPAADLARFLDHLDSCDGCTEYLDQVRTTSRLLGGASGPEPAPDTARDIEAAAVAAFRRWRRDRTGR
jgi:predicted anti-sigma-YlaC factor YlaD